MIKWSVEADGQTIEYDELGYAVDRAEESLYATLIKWYVEPNLPGLKPDKVYRSLRLYSWDGNVWWSRDIHGPGSAKWMEKPEEN